jgi:ketol-acid reductoisomerase
MQEENIKKDKLRNSLQDKMNQQYKTGFVKLIRDISTESEYRDINEEEKIRIIQTSLTESYTAFLKTINQGTINNVDHVVNQTYQGTINNVDHAVNQTSTRNSKLQSILNRLTKILGLQN